MTTEKRKADEDLQTETMNGLPPSQRIKLEEAEENDTTTEAVMEPCTDAVNVGDETVVAYHLEHTGSALEAKDETGNIDNGDGDGETTMKTLENPEEMIATMPTDGVAVKEVGYAVTGDDEDETKPIEEENADNADTEVVEKANVEIEPNEAASDAMSMNVNKDDSAKIEVGNGGEVFSSRKEESSPDGDNANDGGGDDLGEKEGEEGNANDGGGDDLGEKEGEKDNSTEGSKSDETSKIVVENSLNDNDFVEETELVSRQFVGRIIGKSGEMIRDLQARSGCRIDVDQKDIPMNEPVRVKYAGSRATVDFGKKLISMLCKENGELNLPLGSATRNKITVPASTIGKVIGRGGEMIREIQSRSMAKVQVEHSNNNPGADPLMRNIFITGTAANVKKAKGMINFLVENTQMDAMTALNVFSNNVHNQHGSGPGRGGVNSFMGGRSGGYSGGPPGGFEMDKVSIERQFVGRIIGSKGVTITDLQNRSNCDIQVNQDSGLGNFCEINIKGSHEDIKAAKLMINEIIIIGPGHPYAGGHGNDRNRHGHQNSSHRGRFNDYSSNYQQQQPMYNNYSGGQYHQLRQDKHHYQPPQPHMYQNNNYQHQQLQYQQPAQSYPMQQPGYGQQHYQQEQHQQQMPSYSFPPPPPPAAAPGPWKSAKSSDGKTYYYNEKTGETQWDTPPGFY